MMIPTGDKPFDWVAGLAVVAGAAVLVVSLAALVVTLLTVVDALL